MKKNGPDPSLIGQTETIVLAKYSKCTSANVIKFQGDITTFTDSQLNDSV